MQRPRDPIIATPAVARAARVGIVAWAVIGVALVVYLTFRYVLFPIRILFPPLLLALVIVYVLNPVVSVMERRGLRRGWGTLITYLTIMTGVAVGLAYLIPVLIGQVEEFGKSIPDLLERAQKGIVDFARGLGFQISGENIVSPFQPEGGQIGDFIGRIGSITATVVEVLVILVLAPVLAFYVLVDLPKFRQGVTAAIPARRRPDMQAVTAKLSSAIGGYFRGQFMVATFVAVASMIGLALVGLPYWALVGLVAGLFNLVPLIGPFIGAIPALFIAFSTPAANGLLLSPRPGWPLAIAASVVLLLVQQIDNHIISPNVMSRTVKLHPLTVMLSLLVAGTVAGLWGMLLAIPVVASIKIMLIHYWDTRLVWPPDAASAGERLAPGTTEHLEPVGGTAATLLTEPANGPLRTSVAPDGSDVGEASGSDAGEASSAATLAGDGRGATSWWSRGLGRMLRRTDRADRTPARRGP